MIICIITCHSYDPIAVDNLKQHPIVDALGTTPSLKEFNTAIKRMKNEKAPSENGLPAEAFKSMNKSNCRFFFWALSRYWINPNVDPDEFHVALLKLLARRKEISVSRRTGAQSACLTLW